VMTIRLTNVNEHRRFEKTGYEYWYDLRLFDS
jgi:hypothetical protein